MTTPNPPPWIHYGERPDRPDAGPPPWAPACGAPATPETLMTFDADRVTCPDCRKALPEDA